jgi:hypothetical protein
VRDGLPADAASHVVEAGRFPGIHRPQVYPVGRGRRERGLACCRIPLGGIIRA